VKDDVLIDNDVLLMMNFMNFKIKSAQSFECTHKDRLCVVHGGE
jgi:hypothetical protein